MRSILLLATATLLAGAADARPPSAALPRVWYRDAQPAEAPAAPPADAGWADDEWADAGEPNPFFYPAGYDPQYGSAGEVADAEDFAARYGCRPVWDGAISSYVPACN